MTEDVASIAAKLTQAQREAVERAGNWTTAWSLSPVYNGYVAASAAKTSRLFFSQSGRNGLRLYKLNDLGLKVRDHLLSQRTS